MIFLAYPLVFLLAFTLTRIPIAFLNRRLKGARGPWYRYLRPMSAPLNLLLLSTLVHVVAARFGWGTERDIVVVYAAVGWLGLRAVTTLLFEWWFFDVQGVVLPGAVRRLASFALGYVVVLAILNISADVNISDLAIATGVLALAGLLFLQRVLRDLWLGVSMALEKRVVVGDYLRVGTFEGDVIGVDWKSTTLAGASNERFIVPNRILVETPIVHHRRGGGRHRACVEVSVRDDAPPNAVLDALVSAGREIEKALREPAPVARLVGCDREYNRYELVLWVKDPSEQRDVESHARAAVWYRLRRTHLLEEGPLASHDDVLEALASMPLFAVCSPAQVADVAANAHLARFGRGEALFHQGSPGDALYVVLSGALDVVLENGSRHVAAIPAGGFVGERSLMTGEPRSATAVATQDTVTIVIDKADVLSVLRKDPQLASRIAEVMAERDAARGILAHEAIAPAETVTSLLERIRSFFAL